MKTPGETAIAVAAVSVWAGVADAAPISYDVRYTSGPSGSDVGQVDPAHRRTALPGVYHVELFARVRGTDTDHTNDGLTASYLTVVSTQINGGAASPGSGVSGAYFQSPFDDIASRTGGPNNITNDGIGDWGGTSTNIVDTNYMFVRSTTGPDPMLGGGTTGQAVDSNTWEFKIASFDLIVSGIIGVTGQTRFSVAKPIATKNGALLTATYVFGQIDGVAVNFNANDPATPSIYADSIGVDMIVPEPASVTGMLGAAAIALLRRRER